MFESTVNIKLVPLSIQRSVSSFENVLEILRKKRRTPELLFAKRLLSRLFRLKQSDICYKHVVRNCLNFNSHLFLITHGFSEV